MGLLDKFLDAIKLNDDFDEDDYYDEDELDDIDDLDDLDDLDDIDEKKKKPKRGFFSRKKDDFDDLDDEFDDFEDDYKETKKASKETKTSKDYTASYKQSAASSTAKAPKQKTNNKITPMRKKAGAPTMEVIVIRPTSMEDTREIADTLMNRSTVVLNLEGLEVYLAQRIIDFTCGSCYSLNGSLQKISAYIYILTPEGVDISGDFQEILNGAFDIPSM